MNLNKAMKVRTVLKKLGMTQEQLANEIGCSRIYLNEVLNCKRNDAKIEEALDTWIKKNS